MNRFLTVGGLSYLLIGLAHVVIGSLMPEMLAHYGLLYGDGGTIIFAQFAGFLVGVFGTPAVTAKLGPRRALLLALGMLTLAETVYGCAPSWPWMLALAPVAGFGFGMVEAVIGALAIGATGKGNAAAIVRLEVFFGVGALLMPLVSAGFITTDWWQGAFLFVAVLSAAMAVAWGLLSFGTLDETLGRNRTRSNISHSGEMTGATRLPLGLTAIFVLFFFVYVGSEMSIVNFMPSILIERESLNNATASMSVTMFWLTMSIGRFAVGVAAGKLRYASYLLWSCIGTCAALAGYSLIAGTVSAFVFVMLAGLLMSGIFSIGLIYANQRIPGRTEKLTSLLIGAGGVGGAVLPLMTGWSMDHLRASGTAWLLVSFALLLLILMAAAAKGHRSGKPAAEQHGVSV